MCELYEASIINVHRPRYRTARESASRVERFAPPRKRNSAGPPGRGVSLTVGVAAWGSRLAPKVYSGPSWEDLADHSREPSLIRQAISDHSSEPSLNREAIREAIRDRSSEASLV